MPYYVFLSPHLDDAVYSCGGWIFDRAQAGDTVEIRTIFAGDPPDGPLSDYAGSLHARWGYGPEAAALPAALPAAMRRAEDAAACALVGAVPRYFDLPDCIYRIHPDTGAYLYAGDDAIFGEVAQVEREKLVRSLAEDWAAGIPGNAVIFCPLALGGHVDHRIVRMAAERLGRRLTYFADVPYVFTRGDEIDGLAPEGAERRVDAVSEAGFAAWMAANRAYESQFSSFWGSGEEMVGQFRDYLAGNAGMVTWIPG